MSDYLPVPRKRPGSERGSGDRWVGMATNGWVWLFCGHGHKHQDTARECAVKLAKKANDEYRAA